MESIAFSYHEPVAGSFRVATNDPDGAARQTVIWIDCAIAWRDVVLGGGVTIVGWEGWLAPLVWRRQLKKLTTLKEVGENASGCIRSDERSEQIVFDIGSARRRA
jgi:hypothetical protein